MGENCYLHPEAFCSRMTNTCSVLRNNIPMHVVKLSVMQLSRRHTDKLFNKGGGGGRVEIEKMVQTLERR